MAFGQAPKDRNRPETAIRQTGTTPSGDSVVAMGTFDGVHLGHRAIIEKTVSLARRAGLKSVAVTFARPPRLYFAPQPEPTLLTTLPEKIELLRSLGIDQVRALRFTTKLSRFAPEDFFKIHFLGRLRARKIVVGYNFRFGRGRSGDVEFLKRLGAEHGVRVHVVSPVHLRGDVISSGRVRDDLRDGNLARANARLGYRYFLSGAVVRGRGLGRRLGFPTANVRFPRSKFAPPGVFAVRVTWLGGHARSRIAVGVSRDDVWPGMCNVGTRPTLGRVGRLSVEVHLFGFHRHLKGRAIRVKFIKKLRAERKFPSLEALKAQLARDERAAKRALRCE